MAWRRRRPQTSDRIGISERPQRVAGEELKAVGPAEERKRKGPFNFVSRKSLDGSADLGYISRAELIRPWGEIHHDLRPGL